MAGMDTPMMRQYSALKALHPDCILLFRAGDFYEMFGADAIEAAELLQIALTTRDRRAVEPLPMCGIPAHAYQQYVDRLTAAGVKVAIADQMTPADGKTLVKREVTRVITPGTTLSADLVGDAQNNYLVAIYPGTIHPSGRSADAIGVAFLDLGTGQFELCELPTRAALYTLLAQLRPRELLLPEPSDDASQRALDSLSHGVQELLQREGPNPHIGQLRSGWFDLSRAQAKLQDHFGTQNLSGFGVTHLPRGIRSAGALLHYLEQLHQRELPHLTALRAYALDDKMWLDEVTLEHLEVFAKEGASSPRHSLYGILNDTVTPMGARLLKRWLQRPLLQSAQITARLDALSVFQGAPDIREQLRTLFRAVRDLERTMARISMPSAGVAELVQLRTALQALQEGAPLLQALCASELLQELAQSFDPLPELLKVLQERISAEPALKLGEGGYINPGFDAELDALRLLRDQSTQVLAELEARERTASGINSLKVRYNRVFGYYIEVPRTQIDKVPDHYSRRQTLANAERFTVLELQELEEKLLGASEEMQRLEQERFLELRSIVIGYARQVQRVAAQVAALDVLIALSTVAEQQGYVRPQFSSDSASNSADSAAEMRLHIVGGRHPVLEQLQQDRPFVPNDVTLDHQHVQIMLITGPNMAGKSTVMRQVALIQLLAQIGSFVPAQQAQLPLCDRIFTRVGASDDITRGRSTFMVEMNEAANILNNATSRSLILLDEIGRGTSTYDGISIAWAIVEYLHERGALTLFATHYHELNLLAEQLERVCSYCVAIEETAERLVFTHRLVAGGVSRSYGIQVARLAGLPEQVITRAQAVLQQLTQPADASPGVLPASAEQTQLSLLQQQQAQHSTQTQTSPPSAETARQERVLQQLQQIDLNQLTPLEAMQHLYRLQQLAED